MTNDKEKLRELLDIQKPFDVFKNLKSDLEKLGSQINNLNKTKISSKVLNGLSLKNGNLPRGNIFEYTGSRLSQSLSNVHAKELSVQLIKNPQDSMSRIELVEMFLKEADESSLLVSRDAFLFGMQEVESPIISTQKINLALITQKIYLKKLGNFLIEDLLETEKKIKGGGNVDSTLEKQHKKVQCEVNFINKCANLLKNIPINLKYELNLNKSKAETHVPYGDLKYGFEPMLRCLVFLPLAEKNLNLMFAILQRSESTNPMVGYHKSKMYEVISQINLVIGMVGKNHEAKKKGLDNLNRALQSIVGSVKMIGDIPKKPIEKAVVNRFSHLCYTIYGIYNSLGIEIPNSHFVRIKKAVSLLESLARDPKYNKIQSKLIYLLSEK